MACHCCGARPARHLACAARSGSGRMALDVIGTCTAAAAGSDTPSLAVFLAVLFSVYIALDSLLASSVIVRKAAEAEMVTGRVYG